MGTMSGFICARYTIAHLIKQINNQGKLNRGEEKSKVMRDNTKQDMTIHELELVPGPKGNALSHT